MNKRQIGSSYEEMAAAYLIDKGYIILKRNFRCRLGEIDLIARDRDYLVFIEVKYRRDGRLGSPAEAVNGAKQRKILMTARYYLYCQGLGEDIPCRFDVIAILGSRIQQIENAF